MKVKCNKIKIGERVRKDLGDIDNLATSINIHGLLQPIGITKDNELVFGERRLAACKTLEHEEIEVIVIDSDELLECETTENVDRKGFNMSERVEIRKVLKEKEKQKRGKMMAKGIRIPKNYPSVGSRKYLNILAKLSGVSHNTADKENSIVAYGDKTIIDQVDNNELSVGKAYNMVKNMKKENEVNLNKNEVNLTTEIQENEVNFNKNEKNIDKKSTSGIPDFFNITISMKIDKNLNDEIQHQAEELNMSVSSLIRSVLEQYFKGNQV